MLKQREYEEVYEKVVTKLVEDGYVVIENLFQQRLHQKLLDSLDRDLFKQAGISKSNELHLDNQRRRDKICWLEHENSAQKEFLEFCDGLQNYLNRSLYLGLRYYEAHFAIYEEGDFYEKHLDAFRGSKNRVVTTVYYMNEGFCAEDGGTLLLYNEEGNLLESIVPTADKLVVFLSERFPHEVVPAKKKRYSLAGWFRVDK